MKAPLKPSRRMNIDVAASIARRSSPKTLSRSRTPSRTPMAHHFTSRQPQATTPTRARAWPLQRAKSHGEGRVLDEPVFGSGGLPRSARRFARTAHLHEIRVPAGRTRKSDEAARQIGREAEQENVDVFGDMIPPTIKSAPDGLEMGRVLGFRDDDGNSEEDQDAWVDTDVEAEVGLEE